MTAPALPSERLPFHLQPFPYIVPPCEAPLERIYDSEHFMAFDKPAGLLTVPGVNPANRDSVWARLTDAGEDPIIIHRLDLDTSGLLVVAKTRLGASGFGKQLQKRSMQKTYVAVVDGLVAEDSGQIDLPMAPNTERRPLQTICHESGKAAVTDYEVIAREGNTTRVRLFPRTGRSHQLRVHMQQLGHPILGCSFYAPDAVFYAAPRLLLHAHRLVFNVPGRSDPIELEAAVPF